MGRKPKEGPTGDIGQRIKEVRESYKGVGMPQGVLAKRIKVLQSRLSGWENGAHDPEPLSIVNDIAFVLETDPQFLLHGIVKASGKMAARTNPEEVGRIKVYGSIAAGHPRGNASSPDSFEVDVPVQFSRPDFGALWIDGDSMLPLLEGGDLAIFRDHLHPKPGAIMACEVQESGQWVVKRVIYEHGRYVLRSLNPAYADIEEAFRATGFLVGFVRDDGPERLMRLNPYGIKD